MELAQEAPFEPGPLPASGFAPLDVPLRLEVGRDIDRVAIERACQQWTGEGPGGQQSIRLKVDRDAALSGTGGNQTVVENLLLEITGPGVRAEAESASGFAVCRLSAAYIANSDKLRHDILEPLVLFLLGWRDRTPLHASSFMCGGVAMVLAGRSGSGKSCLAKAADDAGFPVLSDDIVYVQLEPGLRVWGAPTAVHLLPGDSSAVDPALRWRNGKLKHALPLRSASSAAVRCDQAALYILEHGTEVSLRLIDADTAIARLWPLDPGFDLMPRQIEAAVRMLAQQGVWQLTLSDDPRAAIRMIASSAGVSRERASA